MAPHGLTAGGRRLSSMNLTRRLWVGFVVLTKAPWPKLDFGVCLFFMLEVVGVLQLINVQVRDRRI
jgi:hypothetical protein